MNIKDTIQFIEFNSFYKEYAPLTPYGQLNKNKYHVITDKDMLCSIYDSIGKIVSFINENSFESDKIENHFRRIALLNSLDRIFFDSADIFLVKKLLVNYKSIVSHLNDKIKQDLNIEFISNDLLKFLSPDGDKKETFYLSSLYSANLAIVR